MKHPQRFRLHKKITQKLKDQGLSDYSQPEIQRNIENYGVKVDGELIYKRLEWVYPEQQLDIQHWPKRPKGNLEGIRTLEETPDYLLLYKPPNLAVQLGTGHLQDNLVSWLVSHYPEQETLLYQSSYHQTSNTIINPTAGLVHRLDKDAQGLLLVARNLKTLDYFQDQFRGRTSQKKYLAVLQGELTSALQVTSWQARDKREPIRQKLFWTEKEANHYDPQTRQAESVFCPKIYCPELDQTLVEVEIKTGRMHQIRLQAESLGHALVGDKVYHRPLTNQFQSKLNINETKSELVILNKTDFSRLKTSIFGQVDFCLLSNHLEVEFYGSQVSRTLIDLRRILEAEKPEDV
jgi:23S rRNA pseudouridine1911/1915/1917 synthase